MNRTMALATVLMMLIACSDEPTGPAPATQLTFTIQPLDDTAGSPLALVMVTARDAQGLIVPTFSDAVTMGFGANPSGATLTGTLTVIADGGLAIFDDLTVSRGDEGITLRATSGTLAAGTSAAFEVAAAVQRQALNYYVGLDLETGGTESCPSSCPNANSDFNLAYNSTTTVHARVFHRPAAAIAHLTGRAFDGVYLSDTAGVVFGTALVDQPFDATRTVLLRTSNGNIYKLGNPVEYGVSGGDSVRLDVARLN